MPSTVTIAQMAPNVSSNFEITANMQSEPSRFVTRVFNYRLATEEVDLIFEYFWDNEDDIGLRKAAVLTLEALSLESMSQVITRFQTSNSDDGTASIQNSLIEDLLLLPALSKSQRVDAAQALLNKTETYSDQRYQEAFSNMKSWVDDDGTIIPLLNQAAREDKTLRNLLYDALASIGDRALPALVQSASGTDQSSQLAIELLQQLALETPEKQIAPLLSVASYGNTERQAVIETLEAWVPEKKSLLIKALESADPTGNEIITGLLRTQENAALPFILDALTQNGLSVSQDITFDEALDLLIGFYDQKQLEEIERIYSQGIAHLEAGDCTQATQVFDQLLAMESQPRQDVVPIAKAYSCVDNYQKAEEVLDRYLATNPQEEAVVQVLAEVLAQKAEQIEQESGFEAVEDFWQEALELYPDSPILRQELGQLYLEQGKKVRGNKDWDTAIAYFEQAKKYLLEPAEAQVEIGKTVARKRWLLLLIGIVIVLFASAIIADGQKTQLSKKYKALQ